MPVGWEEYLKVSNPCDRFHECRRRCKSTFEQHRRVIRCAVEATRPKTVACLGAGVLNDIPFEFLVRSGRPSIWSTGCPAPSRPASNCPSFKPAMTGNRAASIVTRPSLAPRHIAGIIRRRRTRRQPSVATLRRFRVPQCVAPPSRKATSLRFTTKT